MGITTYFKDIWNLIDLAFILTNLTYLIIDIASKGESSFLLRLLCALSILFCSFKFAAYFRAIEEMAFITRMLVFVFDDMKYFFLTLLWVLFGFTLACLF